MKLGERLSAIAAFAAGGGPLADIGTDHAYLPIYLLEQQLIPRAVAVEVHEGPYHAAQDMIRRVGLESRIDLRFGNGLEPVQPGEVMTVVIAGMGGSTMIDILSARPQVTAAAERLVLQPMTAAGALRRWLVESGWRISDEELVTEEGRIYEIILAQQGKMEKFDDIIYDIGPVLSVKKPPLLKAHIAQLLAHTGRILQEMGHSPKAVASPRYHELRLKMLALEEKCKCL